MANGLTRDVMRGISAREDLHPQGNCSRVFVQSVKQCDCPSGGFLEALVRFKEGNKPVLVHCEEWSVARCQPGREAKYLVRYYHDETDRFFMLLRHENLLRNLYDPVRLKTGPFLQWLIS